MFQSTLDSPTNLRSLGQKLLAPFDGGLPDKVILFLLDVVVFIVVVVVVVEVIVVIVLEVVRRIGCKNLFSVAELYWSLRSKREAGYLSGWKLKPMTRNSCTNSISSKTLQTI